MYPMRYKVVGANQLSQGCNYWVDIGVSVTFPSAKRLSPLTQHYGTAGRPVWVDVSRISMRSRFRP